MQASTTMLKPETALLCQQLLRLWRGLDSKWRRNFTLLALLMVFSALAEIASLGVIFPFLAALASPEKVLHSPHVRVFAHALGITSPTQILAPLTVFFIIVAIASGSIRIFVLKLITKFTFDAGADLSTEIYRRTLYQPYITHLSRNSSEIISGLTSKVESVVSCVMFPVLNLVNALTLLLFFTIGLVTFSPLISLTCVTIFGGCYTLVAFIQYRRLKSNSHIIAEEGSNTIRILQEGLGGIRDTLLENSQPLRLSLFSRATKNLRRAQGEVLFMGGSARSTIETLGMVFIATLTYILCVKGGIATALPVLGIVAIGVQRILPAFQQSYNALSLIFANQSLLEDVLTYRDQPLPEITKTRSKASLCFEKEISLQNLAFQYPNNHKRTIEVNHLVIPKGARIGFIGKTGSGKSTLLDIIMGLLTPNEGAMYIDGEPITENNTSLWQKHIAHVPQRLFLTDNSIAENIAFGIPSDQIDLARVKKAAAQAQLTQYIENLPKGYATEVGEKGVRISGGQLQRIGIARALYRNASLLVLDEATSALDEETELTLIDTLFAQNPEMTILMISHRPSSLRHCHSIISIEDGRITKNSDGAKYIPETQER